MIRGNSPESDTSVISILLKPKRIFDRSSTKGAFAGANGILFEGLTNPGLLKEAFAKGIDTSALLKLGPGSAEAQAAYRELLELGVVNSQVQIGDLKNTNEDVKSEAKIINDHEKEEK